MHGISSDLTFTNQSRRSIRQHHLRISSLYPSRLANQPQYPSVVLRLLQTDTHSSTLSPLFPCPRLYKEEPPRGGLALLPLSTGHTSYASSKTDQQGEGKDRRAARTEQATPKRAQTRLVGFRAVQPPSSLLRFFSSLSTNKVTYFACLHLHLIVPPWFSEEQSFWLSWSRA